MGGGDLNSKKSWHPNTMKNQERVWKAEQAAAEEKKRIMELQRERAEERDRAELNNIIKQNSQANMDDRLHWMYDKPDKKVQQEEYLLGKSIDKNNEQSDKPETDAIPAVARRVVGSSMLSTAGDSQVDLMRKIREDPLLLIKERERAARAALLNNPLQRRKIAELLRKEKDEKKESKNAKKDKKKGTDLDSVLAAKLNALGGEKGIDLAALLDSDDSSSDSSSSEDRSKQKKKKKKHEKSKKPKKSKKKKQKLSSDSEDDSSDAKKTCEKSAKRSKRDISPTKSHDKFSNQKRHSSGDGPNETEVASKKIKRKEQTLERPSHYDRDRPRNRPDRSRAEHYRRTPPPQDKYGSKHKKRDELSDEQRASKLAAMMAAGAEREEERGRRVAQQRQADEDAQVRPPRGPVRNEARSLPDSLESRIHSNRHYIQRNSRHMNEHFARR